MARAVTTRRKTINTALAWARRPADLLPDPLDDPDQLQDRRRGHRRSAGRFLFFDWTLENYAVVQERSNYPRFLGTRSSSRAAPPLLGVLIAVPAAWSMAFVPSQADQGHADVDAVDQDAAGRRRALSDLPDVHRSSGCSTPGSGWSIVLMLINLPIIVWMLYTYFKRNPRRDPRGGADGRRDAARGDPLRADADGDARASPRPSCSTSSSPGTRRSGR